MVFVGAFAVSDCQNFLKVIVSKMGSARAVLGKLTKKTDQNPETALYTWEHRICQWGIKDGGKRIDYLVNGADSIGWLPFSYYF